MNPTTELVRFTWREGKRPGRVNVLVKSGLLRELKGAGRGPMGDPVNLVEAVTPAPVQRDFKWPTT